MIQDVDVRVNRAMGTERPRKRGMAPHFFSNRLQQKFQNDRNCRHYRIKMAEQK